MFGMGLGLTKGDFTRLLSQPKAIGLGLLGQLIILPLLAFFLAIAFELSPELAIGLMILSACPGGTMSNVISQLSRANLALSVTLTAITTLVCVFTTPCLIQFSITYFSGEQKPDFSLVETSIGLILITLLPVMLGMLLRVHRERFALAIEVWFRRFSLFFMLGMIAAIIIQEREVLITSFEQVFVVTLLLNLLAIGIGLTLAKSYGLQPKEQYTLGIEVGIQNATMAILIAVSFLNSTAYATSAGVYGITMYVGAAVIVFLARQSRVKLQTTSE